MAVLTGCGGGAQAGSCAVSAPGSGIWICSGPAGADTTQSPVSAPGGALSVTTSPGFGLSTASGNGITLTNTASNTDITFLDENASPITSPAWGIFANNTGSGALSLTSTGVIESTTQSGIRALNYGTDLTIDAATVTSAQRGIHVQNFGSGTLSVTASGTVTGGTNYPGIDAGNSAAGTGLRISSASVAGGNYGIFARNSGSGALSIVADGPVTGTTNNGVDANNSAAGTDLTIETASVSGGRRGIFAQYACSGALCVTATGAVTAATNGIDVNNINGTDLTISATSVTGGQFGIAARNAGSGALSVTASGTVTGTANYGISADNLAGTDLTVSAASVTGGQFGLVARNYGTGAISVTATGTVTGGTSGDGIFASNSNAGTNLTVSAASASGRRGIFADNEGRGALSVTSTGMVTGTSLEGIYADNGSTATSLSISAASVTGTDRGINAANRGTGALAISASGAVVANGTTGVTSGIYAVNSNTGTDLTISAASVSGRRGIFADNNGRGVLSVSSTGVVTGTALNGIDADNSAAGTGLTLSVASVSGASRGINARNSGTGALSVSASGMVEGTGQTGIDANNSGSGTDLTISAASVTGGRYGIYAWNYGSGAFSATADGTVEGVSNAGIMAYNSIAGTGMTISAGAVTGGQFGINARNDGDGAFAVTVSGPAEGTSLAGIAAENGPAGTDLTISAASATGGQHGIYARNYGDAALSVAAGGAVEGTGQIGIDAVNSAAGTDLAISAVSVTGGQSGIVADNQGSGGVTIAATGPVAGSGENGIAGVNAGSGDVSISGTDIAGGLWGVRFGNGGAGSASLTASGIVTGTANDAIMFTNTAATAGDLRVNANRLRAGRYGMFAVASGTGATDIEVSGTIRSGDIGIVAMNAQVDQSEVDMGIVNPLGAGGGDLTIRTRDAIEAGTMGIHADNWGSGDTAITAEGAITASGGNGIQATGRSTSGTLTIAANAVQATGTAILATNDSGGATAVTVDGTIRGGTGSGIATLSPPGSVVDIALESGADIGAASGLAVEDGDGDATLSLLSGSSAAGDIRLGNGSDTLVLAGGDFSAVTQFDGGDDASSADGFIDTTVFRNLTMTAGFGQFANFEAIRIDGGTVTWSDPVLTIGDANPATGLSVVGSGRFVAPARFALAGNLGTASGGIFDASAGGASVTGAVSNAGSIDLGDGAAGDVLRISGNYAGGGALHMDTVLGGDSSATDMMIVSGDTSGSTQVHVTNTGGGGARTVRGIRLIDVGGVSNGAFRLIGNATTPQGEPALVAGAYTYTLEKNGAGAPGDGDWYLRSQMKPVPPEPPEPPEPPQPPEPTPRYNPGTPLYESYPAVLASLNRIGTLRQRMGSRYWNGTQAVEGRAGGSVAAHAEDGYRLVRGAWINVDGAATRLRPPTSTTAARPDIDSYRVELGADMPLFEAADGSVLVAGVGIRYGRAVADVDSIFGDGRIRAAGYGVLGTLTWFGANGFYVDAQAQHIRSDADIVSSGSTGGQTHARGNDATGYAVSLEAGRRFPVTESVTLIPQAQLVYSRVDFDTFRDAFGARVTLEDGTGLTGRLGLGMERQYARPDRNGTISRASLYGSVDLYNEFLDGARVNVSGGTGAGGVDFAQAGDGLWGSLSLGGSYRWRDDMFAVYGEADLGAAFDRPSDNYTLGASLGFRMQW
ncbi:autotransporter outer membrane beta-barrel domain-containing protein [Tropicimonas sp.]|uniref:autotransporter outer membrane beta-barrel domain-containing protein n=1 Tax=Tropicimonas sp. TaxID=2067044 RepID=UPI003A87D097